jgi:hypothetical protein
VLSPYSVLFGFGGWDSADLTCLILQRQTRIQSCDPLIR